MNVLFLGPHPDDIELSCLGVFFKHQKRGDNIFYIVMSDCENLERNKNLMKEHEQIVQILNPYFHKLLHLPNTRLYEIKNREIIRKEFENLRDNKKIDLVYSPWIHDINQDHSTIAEEATRVFRYRSIIQYEVLNSCPHFESNFFVEISEHQFKKKLEILKLYKSQQQLEYFYPETIESAMRFRGCQVRYKYAEAFFIWRIQGFFIE